jgi:hypothetical protein
MPSGLGPFRCSSGGFLKVSGWIDDLQVRSAPIIKQLRPRTNEAIVPHLKQWLPVVYLGHLYEPAASLRAAMLLTSFQVAQVGIWCDPELPSSNTASMPIRLGIQPPIPPHVAVPSESKHRLPADAAIASVLSVRGLAIRCRRTSEVAGQPSSLLTVHALVRPKLLLMRSANWPVLGSAPAALFQAAFLTLEAPFIA